ncbi:MAG: hypothetical protein AAF492_16450, partial [Verrucomicrobiota bacterium]
MSRVEYSDEQLKRWRLVLGRNAEEALHPMGSGMELNADERCMDEALAAIYDETGGADSAGRGAGHEMSSPKLNKWLGDIRTYFEEDVVSVIQQDAIERKGL